MKKMFYPAVFETDENGTFTVIFPDIDGAITCGDNMERAYQMAFECLGLVLSHMEDSHEPIPKASAPHEIPLTKGQHVVIVEFDMDKYKKLTNGKAVKKTLSIPSWLNEEAVAKNINFSNLLQEAIKDKLGI